MEILIAAFIFYFVIKHAVRQAIIEAKVKEKELSLQVRINDLLDEITRIGYEIIGSESSKEIKMGARTINEDCIRISMSNDTEEEKYTQFKIKENEMILLQSEG